MFTKLTKKENRWAWILTGAIIAITILFARNASALVSYSPVAQIGTGDINSAMILNNTLLPEDLNTSVSSTWLFNNDIIVNRNSTTTGNHTVSKNLIVSGNTTLATSTQATTTITNLTVTNCAGCGINVVVVPWSQLASTTPIYVAATDNKQTLVTNATSTFYKMPDNVGSTFEAVAQVPQGKTSISAIKIIYSMLGTGNVKLRTYVTYSSATYPNTPILDNDFIYPTGGGTNTDIGAMALPAAAYDTITSVASNGLIRLHAERDGSDAATDTYNADFLVYGVEFDFN